MSITRTGGYGTPGFARGVETLRSLEVKQDEAIRKVMPGAAPALLRVASHFLRRTVTLAHARRRVEQDPQSFFWAVYVRRAKQFKEDVERKLRDAGVTDETLERLGELYPFAEDLRREMEASMDLQASHGCAKCRRCFSSWERSAGDSERDDAAPFCKVYGDVPAFCFDFEPTRSCSRCGTGVSPKPFPKGDPIPVECRACTGPR
jgi:hypothetical protein